MSATAKSTQHLAHTEPPVLQEKANVRSRRRWLATYAALLALSAWAGAAGLAAGFLTLPMDLEGRLPFGSPLLGGLALALIVGVPAAILTVMAWTGHSRARNAAVGVGVVLIGWIMVEVAFLREVSVLHAVYLAVGVGLVAWGGKAIPDGPRSASTSLPKRSTTLDLDQLPIWRPRVAYGLLAFAALGYASVALLLAMAHARAMPEPYLRIDAGAYFTWGTLFYAPTIIAAWLLASDVVWLLATAARRRPDFGAVLTAMAAAVGVGTLGTLVPDLVTSPLRALGVINETAWEDSITQHTGWFAFTWVTLTVYLLLFLIAFPLAVRQSTRLRGAAAVLTGVVAFMVLQGVEYLLVR